MCVLQQLGHNSPSDSEALRGNTEGPEGVLALSLHREANVAT